jgi:hypothetical protein
MTCGFAKGKGSKYCQKCGKEVNPEADVCVHCGNAIKGSGVMGTAMGAIPDIDTSGVPAKGFSIASLCCGIVAIVTATWGVGIVIAIVGLVLGVLAKKKLDDEGAPSGMATAGIFCSGIALVICISCIACTIYLCTTAGGMDSLVRNWF